MCCFRGLSLFLYRYGGYYAMFENGIETIRADFHLHTRKDKEFKYNGEENDYIKLYVKGLVDAGIGIGVITNHNKFDENEYKAIKRAAKKRKHTNSSGS